MVTQKRLEKLQKVVQNRQRDLVVVLEDLYDPHNAEAIFRTMDGFGVQTAYLIFDKQPPFNPKKVGKATSASANKWLDFAIYKSAGECLNDLKKTGYRIVATVLDDEARSLYGFEWPEKIALLLGNEHAGLSAEAVSLSDHKVYLPMLGMVQSLNVSVAAGIFLAEIVRKRRGKDFKLNRPAQQKLLQNFLKR